MSCNARKLDYFFVDTFATIFSFICGVWKNGANDAQSRFFFVFFFIFLTIALTQIYCGLTKKLKNRGEKTSKTALLHEKSYISERNRPPPFLPLLSWGRAVCPGGQMQPRNGQKRRKYDNEHKAALPSFWVHVRPRPAIRLLRYFF